MYKYRDYNLYIKSTEFINKMKNTNQTPAVMYYNNTTYNDGKAFTTAFDLHFSSVHINYCLHPMEKANIQIHC